jgi:hypothetical protein
VIDLEVRDGLPRTPVRRQPLSHGRLAFIASSSCSFAATSLALRASLARFHGHDSAALPLEAAESLVAELQQMSEVLAKLSDELEQEPF